MKSMGGDKIEGSLSLARVFSHPGIVLEKNLVTFTDEARKFLVKIVEELQGELANMPTIEGSHPEAVQRVSDAKVGEILASNSQTVNIRKGLLGKLAQVYKGKRSNPVREKVLGLVHKKDSPVNSISVYLQIDGQQFPVPILVWPRNGNMPMEQLIHELIQRMNERARLVRVNRSRGH